jgi:hypothetical protein
MTKIEARKALAVVLGSATALVGYVALTVPVFAMTGPTVLAIALGAATYFTWPRSHKPVS